MYKYLAFSGGGIKGLSFLGSLRVLSGLGLIDNVKEFMGCSVGGIFATMLSLGFTPKELYEITFALNPVDFVDMNIVEIFTTFGLDSGDKIVKLFRSMIKIKIDDDSGGADITFKQHYDLTGKVLVLTGSCMNDKKCHYFNVWNTPHMKICTALRATISFPLFFTPVEWNGKLYIDGAFLCPNPAMYYDKRVSNGEINLREVLILRNETPVEYVDTGVMMDSPFIYLVNMFNSFKKGYSDFHSIVSFDINGNTIKFKNSIFAMNFDLSEKDKLKMYMNGVLTTLEWYFGVSFHSGIEWCGDCGWKECICLEIENGELDECDKGHFLGSYQMAETRRAFNQWKCLLK